MVKVIDRAHKNTLHILTTITFLSGAVLTSTIVSADDIVDQVNITVPASCTLSSTGEDSHNAEITNGTYNSSIGETTIKAFCNDNNGFAIYAIGFTNNEYGKTVLTDSTLGSTYDIVTGTATSGNTSNWAMKLSTVTSPTPTYPITIASDTEGSFSSFHTVPATYTLVASRNSATDIGQNAEGSTLKTTYQTYIRTTQLAGTYTGKVKYTMVHPANAGAPTQPVSCNPGYICYSPNASGVADSMGDQSITSSATTANLWASNFQRTGYGFAGWSDKYDWVLNENDANGNGTGANAGYHIYGPNATITFTAGQYSDPNPGLSLYAVWVPSAGNLQGWTCPDNSTMPIGRVTALKDQRDNDVYAVAKLADGKCWMIENLRLDNDAAHNSDGTLAQGYNSSFIGLADPEASNFKSSTVANSLYSTNGSTAAPAITGSYTDYRFPRYNNQNTANPATNMTAWDNDLNVYSIGNYYTWAAAIADTSHYDTNNQSITTTSICPTGWRLPTGGQTTINTTADYYVLVKATMNNQEPDQGATNGYAYYSNNVTNTNGDTAMTALTSYPNDFISSGYFLDSSMYARGNSGYYWASTAGTSYYVSYNLHFSNSSFWPGTGSQNKNTGFSIRCVR